MDGELTAIPSATVRNVGGGSSDIPAPDKCREIFEKAFPSYLAQGMTYDEFYRQDHTLVIAYRRAHEIRRKEENENFWLMGAYVYHAICKAAPLLMPFNKHPKPEDYLDKPFPLYADEAEGKAESNNAVDDKGMAYMLAQMTKINRKFGQ